jgi:hypothetical protein
MVNEHKAHASFVLRIINTFINCGLTLILAIILYAIFFPIDNTLVAGYVFCIIPTFSFIIWILFGMFYREISYLSNYNKHKLLCESIRDITITIITNVLLTTGTSILYQLQNPIRIMKFVMLFIGIVIFGALLVGILITLYFKRIKILKSLKN